jgi:hypothetical protein
MITFNKPINLDGAQLRNELRNVGISITDEINAVFVDGDVLRLDIAESDAEAAAVVVAAHNGTV